MAGATGMEAGKNEVMLGKMETLLLKRRDAILADYIVRLRGLSESYRRRPEAELRQTTRAAYDAALAFMFRGDPKPMDRFVELLVEKRLKAQFKLSEVQRAFSGLRNAIVPALLREIPKDGLGCCLATLDECADYAIGLFSEKFQLRHEADQVRANLALSAALDELRREKNNVLSANRLKDEFLANLSHELKTPLTGIIGFSKIMMDAPADDPKRTDKLRIVHEQGKALLRLINTLLVIAEIDAGLVRVSRDAVEFKDIVEMAVKNIQKLKVAEGHPINISLGKKMPPVICDTEKMTDVVFELLLNSLKFSEPGGKIDISADCSGENLTLSICDQGVGIDAQEMDRIFSPFYQQDGSITRRSGGNGLGLTMIKKVVELHRGRITVASNPGKGSTFTIVAPLVPPVRPLKP